MKQASERVLQALASLEHNHEFTVVREWLEESLAAQDVTNRRASGEALARGQGIAICLETFLDTAGKAREVLRKKYTQR